MAIKCEFDNCEEEATTRLPVFCCDKHLEKILKMKIEATKELEKILQSFYDDPKEKTNK